MDLKKYEYKTEFARKYLAVLETWIKRAALVATGADVPTRPHRG